MKRIFVPTSSASDWQPLLAQPDLHWKVGKSAMTLAASWESAHPLMPPEVARACASADIAPDYIAAFPEWSVALPGGATTSQTDLLVLAKSTRGLTVIAVEGKVDETLGPTLGEKRADASAGVSERLRYLHEELGLSAPSPDALRYQLFHRTVSALSVARDLGAAQAIMLIHSFSAESKWYDDYCAFANHLGAQSIKGSVARIANPQAPQLFIGWVPGDLQFLRTSLPPAR